MRRALGLLALITCLSLSGQAQAYSNSDALIQLTPRAKADRDQGIYPHLRKIDHILARVSEIRGLPVKKPIKVDTLDKPELYKNLQHQVEKELAPAKIEAEVRLYRQWQMLPPDFNYAQFMLDLYTEQIGGYYDPETQMLYLMKDTPLAKLDMETLIAHELTHALQDQHYNLRRYSEAEANNDDATLARMSLVEGDATATSIEYIQARAQEGNLFKDLLGSLLNLFKMQASFKKLQEAPPFIKNSLLFPYEEGLKFVQYFRQNKGWSWSQFDQLYQNPPTATRYILHPSHYLQQKSPQVLKLDTLPALTGAQSLAESVMGEMGIQQVFAHHLESEQAIQAAMGWNGDTYQVLKKANQTMLHWASSWETENDAKEFTLAYRQLILKRFPQARLEKPNPKDSAERWLYQTGPTWILLQQHGPKVFVAEGWDQPKPALNQAIQQLLAKAPASRFSLKH